MILKNTIYFDTNFDSRRKRRAVVKTIVTLLIDIRKAEEKSLYNTPENLQNSESFAVGEFAVDALDEAVAILADVY